MESENIVGNSNHEISNYIRLRHGYRKICIQTPISEFNGKLSFIMQRLGIYVYCCPTGNFFYFLTKATLEKVLTMLKC